MKLVPPGEPPEPPAPDLVEQAGSTPYGSPVIDLDSVRVAYGLPNRKVAPACQHKSLVYNTGERRVWCNDCHRTIDAFDAFMTLTNAFHGMVREANAGIARAKEAEEAVLVRRVAKDIDRLWGRKMAPCCPQCGRGLMPEDFTSHSSVSFEYEVARRTRRQDHKP